MKKIVIFVLSFFCCGLLHSQEINCAEKLSSLSSFVKNKEFLEAKNTLDQLVRFCPNQSEKTFLIGEVVLQNSIEIAADSDKESAVEDYVKLLSLYDKYFPNNENGNDIKAAMVLYENKIEKKEVVYSLFDKAFKKDKFQYTNPNALYTYFMLFNERYSDKSYAISFDDLLQKYSDVSIVLERNKDPEKQIEFRNVTLGVNSIVNQYLTPENLISYAENNFEKNKSNADWLASTANLLSDKATASPIFGKIAAKLHELKPSSDSAYYLGDYNLKNKNQEVAIDYFTQSATLASEASQKAKIAYTTASILINSDKAKAKEMIAIAIENDPSNGRSYLFLGNLYANSASECASNEEEKSAIYKLASNTVLKAGVVEPRLKQTAEKMSEDFLKNSTKRNQTIKVGCWINETVQL